MELKQEELKAFLDEKVQQYNHPSFIEPYQGAATGVGGILRDVFTMGARPIALMNSIHFGSPDNKKTQNLLSYWVVAYN